MVFHKNSIILYGGITNKGLDDENIYRYTIDNRQWKVIQITGVKPGFRVFHTMNYFKHDSLIIFGGKVKNGNSNTEDLKVNNDAIHVDLSTFDCTTPFISNVGPTARFGHGASFNYNFTPESEHIIVGGLDQSYCPIDAYIIKEIEVTTDKKWVYEQQKMHSNQSAENRDEIFEIAKKTIISYKKKLELLSKQNIEVNRK
jgi:hypothetical protein